MHAGIGGRGHVKREGREANHGALDAAPVPWMRYPYPTVKLVTHEIVQPTLSSFIQRWSVCDSSGWLFEVTAPNEISVRVQPAVAVRQMDARERLPMRPLAGPLTTVRALNFPLAPQDGGPSVIVPSAPIVVVSANRTAMLAHSATEEDSPRSTKTCSLGDFPSSTLRGVRHGGKRGGESKVEWPFQVARSRRPAGMRAECPTSLSSASHCHALVLSSLRRCAQEGLRIASCTGSYVLFCSSAAHSSACMAM